MPNKLELERSIQVGRAREHLGNAIEALRLAAVLTADADDRHIDLIERAHSTASHAATRVVELEREIFV